MSYQKYINLNNYFYSIIPIEEFIKIPVYINQRELNQEKIKEIIKYQQEYYDKNEHYELFSCPLLAINNNLIFDTTENTKSNIVLFDGQHRQNALKNLPIDNQNIEVKIFNCKNNDKIYKLFKNFNKQTSLTYSEISKKTDINVNKIINNSIDLFYNYSTKENPKSFYFGKFYNNVFKKILNDDIELNEYIIKNNININIFVEFLKKINYKFYEKIFDKNTYSDFHYDNSSWKRNFKKFIEETNLNLLNKEDNFFRFIYPKNYNFILKMIKLELEI